MRNWRRVGLLACLVAALMLSLGAAAMAADGPTPPELGDPIASNVSPHGGYGAGTNYCLNCHDIHQGNAPGTDNVNDYALLSKDSVEAVCETCHTVGGSGGAGPVGVPGFPGTTIGTASSRPVYNSPSVGSSHPLGASAVDGHNMTGSAYSYGSWQHGGGPFGPSTEGSPDGGLYCASCHTPHGDFGQLVNNWDPATDEGRSVFSHSTEKFLDYDGVGGVWYWCATTGDVIPGDAVGTSATPPACVPAQVSDAEGQLVYLYGYKLLSAYPNHTYGTPQTYDTAKYGHDTAAWCGACHSNRLSDDSGADPLFTGAYHNHPTGCTSCHGNPADGSSSDFPHTSTMDELLISYPDALCAGCHTNLP